jgi:hypothetical protein
VEFLQNGIGGGPYGGAIVVVVTADEMIDFAHQFLGALGSARRMVLSVMSPKTRSTWFSQLA